MLWQPRGNSDKGGSVVYLQVFIGHHGEGQVKGEDAFWLQKGLRLAWRGPEVLLQPANITTKIRSKSYDDLKNNNHA